MARSGSMGEQIRRLRVMTMVLQEADGEGMNLRTRTGERVSHLFEDVIADLQVIERMAAHLEREYATD